MVDAKKSPRKRSTRGSIDKVRRRRFKLGIDFGETPLSPADLVAIRAQVAAEWGPPRSLVMVALAARGSLR